MLKMEVSLAILALSLVAFVRGEDISPSNGTNDVAEESERIKVCLVKPLGCFKETKPGSKSTIRDSLELNFFMSAREKVATEFRLWAPGKKKATVITNWNYHVHFLENKMRYDPKLKAIFIIHGYQGGEAPWAVTMKDALMQREPSNIFIVDWKRGAGLLYGTARANTWVVGAELGRLVQQIALQFGLTLDKVHIIGHSLGSHVAGFAGEWLKLNMGKKVRRITGLDVAGPDFEEFEEGRRLDRNDAEFVDTIHSNSAYSISDGFGIVKPVGHFDFYPNGGERQPGCRTSGQAVGDIALESLEYTNPTWKIYDLLTGHDKAFVKAFQGFSCNHGRAYQLFTESITSTSCKFIAEECNSWADYQAGKCHRDHLKIPMGYDSEQYKEHVNPNDSKKFYLITNKKTPFCKKL